MRYLQGHVYGDGNILIKHLGSRNKYKWARFKCRCGNEFDARISAIVYGNTRGCGCSKRVGGITKHKLYPTFTLIKTRCYCDTNEKYKYYGARGICMSVEFKDNPKAFIEYIESLPNYENRERDNLTLDRIDNNGNYEKGNLRLATTVEQSRNRRNVH